MSTAGLPEEIVSCTAPSLLPQFLFISSLQPDKGSRTMAITSRNSPASTNFLLCFFTKNSFYVFYFHPAHCQDELRKPIETKKDQRKNPAKGFAASLHAPHECTVFERISSIKYSEFWVLSFERDCIRRNLSVKSFSAFFAGKLAKHSEGMRRVKGFSEKNTPFFAPEYIFSPTDNFVAVRRCPPTQ